MEPPKTPPSAHFLKPTTRPLPPQTLLPPQHQQHEVRSTIPNNGLNTSTGTGTISASQVYQSHISAPPAVSALAGVSGTAAPRPAPAPGAHIIYPLPPLPPLPPGPAPVPVPAPGPAAPAPAPGHTPQQQYGYNHTSSSMLTNTYTTSHTPNLPPTTATATATATTPMPVPTPIPIPIPAPLPQFSSSDSKSGQNQYQYQHQHQYQHQRTPSSSMNTMNTTAGTTTGTTTGSSIHTIGVQVNFKEQVAAEYITFFDGPAPDVSDLLDIGSIVSHDTPTEETLQQWEKRRKWTQVIQSVETMFKDGPTRQVKDMLRIQSYRIRAYLKLDDVASAQRIFDELHDTMNRSQHDDIPLQLRMLQCEIHHVQGHTTKSIMKYGELYARLQARAIEMETKTSADTTEIHKNVYDVAMRLVKLHLYQLDYPTAIRLLHTLIEQEQHASNWKLLNFLGRVILQSGDTRRARQVFDQVSELQHNSAYDSASSTSAADGADVDASTASDALTLTVKLNNVLMLVADSDFLKAHEVLETLLDEYPNSLEVTNNYALVALYTNNIIEAVTALEDYIVQDPCSNLDETLVANLCTLYELSSTRPKVKKTVIQQIVDKYGPDDFDKTVIGL
jgi:tetratricopeptide (TPR) repeat protein